MQSKSRLPRRTWVGGDTVEAIYDFVRKPRMSFAKSRPTLHCAEEGEQHRVDFREEQLWRERPRSFHLRRSGHLEVSVRKILDRRMQD